MRALRAGDRAVVDDRRLRRGASRRDGRRSCSRCCIRRRQTSGRRRPASASKTRSHGRDPVDLARGLGPEPFRIALPARVEVAVAARHLASPPPEALPRQYHWSRPAAARIVCRRGSPDLYLLSRGCAVRQEHNPRGLIDLKGSCHWPGPWAWTYGAHLRCRFPGSTTPTAEAATRNASPSRAPTSWSRSAISEIAAEKTRIARRGARTPRRPFRRESAPALRRSRRTASRRSCGTARPSRCSGRCAPRSIRAA